jgi:hypothetical protein
MSDGTMMITALCDEQKHDVAPNVNRILSHVIRRRRELVRELHRLRSMHVTSPIELINTRHNSQSWPEYLVEALKRELHDKYAIQCIYVLVALVAMANDLQVDVREDSLAQTTTIKDYVLYFYLHQHFLTKVYDDLFITLDEPEDERVEQLQLCINFQQTNNVDQKRIWNTVHRLLQ